MNTGAWLAGGVFIGLGVVYAVTGGLARDWRGVGRLTYGPDICGSFILTIAYHAYVRTAIFGGLGLASVAVLMVVVGVGTTLGLLEGSADPIVGTAFLIWLVVWWFLILANRPSSLVPPNWRDKPGAIAEAVRLVRDSRDRGADPADNNGAQG